MFTINDDLSIYLTRGDIAFFRFMAEEDGKPYVFVPNDVVRFKVTERKNCEKVVMQKKFLIEEETDHVDILLTENDTKIGDVISKPTDFWYEVELNPFTNPQTVIGYDEVGPKILKLFPEANDIIPVAPEEIPPVDSELSLTSERPIQNQAVARALIEYEERVALAEQRIDDYASDAEQAFEEAIDAEADKAIERVNASSETAKNDANRAESAADRAEEAAGRAEAVADLKIDTELNKDSNNPVANRIVAEALENYLPKSGGDVSGKGFDFFGIKRKDLTTNVFTKYHTQWGVLGYLGFGEADKPSFIDSTGSGVKELLHTGNMSDYVLPIDGSKRIEAPNASVLKANNANGANAYIGLYGSGSYIGGIGFTGNADYDLEVLNKNGSGGKKVLHAGNFSNYALPKDGGGTQPTLSTNHPQVLSLDNVGENSTTLLVFKHKGAVKGRFGTNWEGAPVYQNAEGTNHKFLHTGNSAAVHIDTSAPSDTSSLWVY